MDGRQRHKGIETDEPEYVAPREWYPVRSPTLAIGGVERLQGSMNSGEHVDHIEDGYLCEIQCAKVKGRMNLELTGCSHFLCQIMMRI